MFARDISFFMAIIRSMEDIIEAKPTRSHKVFDALMLVLSSLVSLFVAGYSFYLSCLGNVWFIAIGIYFAIEGFGLVGSLFIKDEFKAMHFQGVIQVISVILLMSYLLFMILWNDANGLMDYSLITYLSLGGAALIKLLVSFIDRAIINKSYSPMGHANSNSGLISVFFLALIIELIVVNQFYPGTSTALFDNLLKEKPLWVYIIDIASNAILTVLAALLALSTIIRAKTREILSTSGKIKHTLKWFSDNEVSMFFGLIFTLYLAVLSIINMKQSFFYILLFFYYLGTVLIRLFNYLWHKRIQRKCGDNQIKENRLSSWILLVDALTYLAFSNVLVLAAIFMMINKANMGSNIYLFLFLVIPMGLMRFITSNKSIKKNRKENNTYRLGVSLIGLVSVFFSILEIVAISLHNLSIVWIRYVFIILAIIAVKIAVIVVAIIFVVHWLRSIILNRHSKERKYLREKKQ